MSIDFNSLFNLQRKCLDTDLKFKIEEVDAQNELILVSIKNQIIYYKNLIVNKSDIWPIPLINEIISLKNIQYKYDENYNLRLFIKINKINESYFFTENNDLKELDCSSKNIINTLKNELKINVDLISNLFFVDSIDSVKEAYLPKCIGEKEIYILEKKILI